MGSSDTDNTRRRPRRKRRDGLLTTGDMARLSSNTLRTVRFYEEEEILQPTLRSVGGHRLFSNAELDRLLLVTDMRAAGLSLDEIKEILSLKLQAKTGAEASQLVGKFLQTQITAMATKLAALERLQKDFSEAEALFRKCHYCNNDETFPTECAHCGIMDGPMELPRTVRVLWGLHPDEEEAWTETRGQEGAVS